MRIITRALFASAIAVALASSVSAQQQGGGGQGGGGQRAGGQGGQGGQAAGLPFGSGGNVGLETQQMQTVTNAVTNAQSNVLGGYYANPYYQGRIGTYGAQSPGGFGQALYNATGTASGVAGRTGGVTNSGFGATSGRGGGGGGAGGMTSTGGFGGQGGATQGFSGGTGGFGGATTGGGRTGQTGQTGFGGAQTGGFGGAQAGGGLGGRQAGGLGGRQGGQFGNRGGMGGATNPNAVAADRAINVFYQPSGMGSIGSPTGTPLASRAQSELRGQFDRTSMISAGKSIDVQVSGDGIARLRGTVASNDEKRLAIGLAQLTPGVRSVVSELTVAPNQ